jgi:hypothetical protein
MLIRWRACAENVKGFHTVYLLDHAMLLSAVGGIACGLLIARTRPGLIVASCIPAFVILATLLYHAYVGPYEGGGASMWPIAFVVAGIPAVACGCLGCGFGQVLRRTIR